MKRFTLVVALFGLVGSGCSAPVSEVAKDDSLGEVVTTSGGAVRGVAAASGVTAFKGIPYAAPPVGDLRWAPPQAAASWQAELAATDFSKRCWQPQPNPEAFYGGAPIELDEDCLTLNVWTGAESAEDARPVMVWIHGGGLVTGSGASPWYDVTINYRLGAFGFLAHPQLTTESANDSSGNYGLLDQVAALEWVRDNVAAFGGDPGNVTIFGESAGSWSVNYMVATPFARGLFHKAIGQSGGNFAKMATLAEAEEVGFGFVESLALGESIADLRARSAEEIVEAMGAGARFALSRGNVDGWMYPEQIYDTFAGGRQNDVAIMVGSNADEGTALWEAGGPETVAEHRERVVRQYGDFADEILAAYPAASDDEARGVNSDLQSDHVFAWQMRTWARLTENVSSPAYLYYFSRVPPGPEAEQYGAYHAAEIPYAFDNLALGRPHTWEQIDHDLAATMSSYWVNFATTGDPNGDSLPAWPAYATASDEALELGDEVKVVMGLKGERLDILDAYHASRRGESAGLSETPSGSAGP